VTIQITGEAEPELVEKLRHSFSDLSWIKVNELHQDPHQERWFRFSVSLDEQQMPLFRTVIDFYTRSWDPESTLDTWIVRTSTDGRCSTHDALRFTEEEEGLADGAEGQARAAELAEVKCSITT
jgi:hypothetical protein